MRHVTEHTVLSVEFHIFYCAGDPRVWYHLGAINHLPDKVLNLVGLGVFATSGGHMKSMVLDDRSL